MDRLIIDKFFNNSATPGETRRELEWFDTLEDREYLEEKLDADFELIDEADDYAIENYLSWKSGRLIFEDLHLLRFARN